MKSNKGETIVIKDNVANEQARIKELAKEQRYIKSFGDMINAALWNMDINEHDEVIAVNWSDEFRHMFGFENTEDFPNTISSWSDRLHPEDREITLYDFYNGIKSRDTVNFVYDIEYRILRKNDEYCWYHAVGRMEDKGDGNRRMYGIIMDISASRKAERDREIIEILASEYSSVYYIDLTTDNLNPYTMNDETETTFGSVFRSGITYSEAFRLYVDKLIYPEDKDMMLKAGSLQNIEAELEHKKTFITTYRNSENKYCEMKFVKVGSEYDKPEAVALGFAEKDEVYRAEKEMEIEQQRYNAVVKVLSGEYSSVYYADIEHDILLPYGNSRRIQGKFGENAFNNMSYTQAAEAYIANACIEKDRDELRRNLSRDYMRQQLAAKQYYTFIYQNDKEQYCEMKCVRASESGAVNSVVVGFSVKDEEFRAEMERKKRQERDNAVITGLSDDFGCVVYTDYENYSEIHYRFDPLFEKHVKGWSEISNFKERLEKLTNTIMHPEDRDTFWESTRPDVVHKAVDRDGVYYVNFRTLIDGEETYYQAKFARDEMHPETNVIAGFHNVDAETKREMEALEQAKSANKSKSDFLFNMSHDIRTPMNAIIGFTDMAMKNADNSEIVIESLKKTQLAGNLLLSLINNILDMSRIESGKIALSQDEVDVEMLFANIEDTMEVLAKERNVDLTFDVGNVSDRYVYCDVSRCSRVLINLITNGIKYSEAGGYVKVSCRQTGSRDGYGLYRYTIEDNGIGMSEEFQKHAFDEFARENTATVSGIQGTGLGLSVCRTFVGAMNGTIECQSKQGEGTTFTVTLPFKIREKSTRDENVAAEDNSAEYDLRGRKILLVEDNELNMEIAECILSDEGMEVETANDGSVAVQMLKEKGSGYYDAILMDIQMPVMDGYAATGEIRKMYPDAGIPIIALSANAFAEDKAASIAAGMNDHVAKPINIRELKATMAKFIC